VAKDAAEAVKWYRKATEQGYAEGQNNLGFCYWSGQGVLTDYTEAVKWYRKAAEQGHAGAQHNLGVCYAQGQGVMKDYVEAYKWLSLASAQGNENAKGAKSANDARANRRGCPVGAGVQAEQCAGVGGICPNPLKNLA
jgi:tetratricopeptide (TPR) repeat protein